jgi:hypothetical protein
VGPGPRAGVFYGFFGGEADQWQPSDPYDGQTTIGPPTTPGYHFMRSRG